MTKLHTTVGQQLVAAEKTIEKQAERITELGAIILKLKTRLAKHGLSTSTSDKSPKESSSPAPSSLRSSSSTTVPSYLQPTASSRAKTRAGEPEELPETLEFCRTKIKVDGVTHIYIDGSLVSTEASKDLMDIPNYARDTCANWIRTSGPRRHRRRRLTGWGDIKTDSPSDVEASTPSPQVPRGWDAPNAASSIKTEKKIELSREEAMGRHYEVEVSLRERTRYFGQPWERRGPIDWDNWDISDERHPAQKIDLPSKFAFRVLRRALVLAQESLFCALRQNWPDLQRSYFPGGPHEVRFGRTDIESLMNCLEYSVSPQGLEGSGVRHCCDSVAHLRNAFCHYGYYQGKHVEDLDHLVQSAQWLAVKVCDEDRAYKLRALRDSLTTRAEAEFRALEATDYLIVLPFTQKKWAPHQEETFKYALCNWRETKGQQKHGYHPVIMRAAHDWENRKEAVE